MPPPPTAPWDRSANGGEDERVRLLNGLDDAARSNGSWGSKEHREDRESVERRFS